MRGICYFDVVPLVLIACIVLGRFVVQDSPASPTIARDVAGAWVPVLAVTLLLPFRRRAYTQATPWVLYAFSVLALIAIGAIFWRWNAMAFIGAMFWGSLLVLAGLVLRTKFILEPLSRTDVFRLSLWLDVQR